MLKKELVGVIVDHHPVNAYRADAMPGAKQPPDCSSMDGKVGMDQDGNRKPCNSCLMERLWGIAEDGRQSLQNMRRLYILRDGESLPLLLTLPQPA